MIDIQENQTEYLLFIPASQRERAKAIQGRQWDPGRTAWVYPRTARVYDALVAEFGDDVAEIAVTRPGDRRTKASSRLLSKENQELNEEIRNIRSTIELLAKSTSQDQNEIIQSLKSAVASQQQQLTDLSAVLEERVREISALENQLQERGQELEEARAAQPAPSQPDLKENVAALAMMTTGNDAVFKLTLDRLALDSSLPIEFSKIIEHSLRVIMKAKDPDLSLYDLLVQARDAELLSDEAMDLAHTIRKQRNIIAHQHVETRTKQMRILFVLCAASLLWPHLGKQPN